MSEISITYGGEVLHFTPSNRLLRRLDAELAPETFLGVLSRMDGKEAPLPSIAFILSFFINAAGGEADEDTLFSELLDDVNNNNGEGLSAILSSLTGMLDFAKVTGKNSLSPAKPLGVKLDQPKTKTKPKRKQRT